MPRAAQARARLAVPSALIAQARSRSRSAASTLVKAPAWIDGVWAGLVQHPLDVARTLVTSSHQYGNSPRYSLVRVWWYAPSGSAVGSCEQPLQHLRPDQPVAAGHQDSHAVPLLPRRSGRRLYAVQPVYPLAPGATTIWSDYFARSSVAGTLLEWRGWYVPEAGHIAALAMLRPMTAP